MNVLLLRLVHLVLQNITYSEEFVINVLLDVALALPQPSVILAKRDMSSMEICA